MVYATVADFHPPSALTELREWQKRHADALDQLPDDAVRIDVGRAVNGGDFARVMSTIGSRLSSTRRRHRFEADGAA